MKVSELSGAHLDYHVARAEGVPDAELELRAKGTLCVRNIHGTPGKIVAVRVLDYSRNWALTGPLVEKHEFEWGFKVDDAEWAVGYQGLHGSDCGATLMIAICRAVVRAAFGDEVEDLP